MAGFEVSVHGVWHAELHRDIPRVPNIGFLIDGQVFHPGDALTVPPVPVGTLLVPIHGPWSRTADLIDWIREVNPDRAIAVHDAALSDVGRAMIAGFLGENSPVPTGVPYQHLASAESIRLT
ncbi:MAG TPA: hypothetical protein VF444_16110 [Pseudonocardiaceae bacterium]